MIIATSGHVDHGKTSLVREITGVETDRLDEEKARGLTIDLGFAYTTLAEQRIGFIDVPGHIKFISNMLAGVSAIDFGLLVIAADDGPMPQTMEHLAILDLIGITTGAIALTKIDRVSPAQLETVKRQITQLVAGSFLAGSPVFPVSSTNGKGINSLNEHLQQCARSLQRKRSQGYFRLAIDRTFSVKGAGQVVTGSVVAGTVKVGDEVYLAPQGHAVRVRSIHRQNQPSEIGEPGDRCALNIAGNDLARAHIRRGDYLTANPLHPDTARSDIHLRVLASEPVGVKHNMPVHVHAGANHVTGRLALLGADSIAPGESGLAQLILKEPINLWFGDRLIIRDQAATRTLGGGQVLDPSAPGRGRAHPARLQELAGLQQDQSLTDCVSQWLLAKPQGIHRHDLQRRFNMTDAEIDGLLQTLAATPHQQHIIGNTALETLQQHLLGGITDWHKHHPNQPSLPLQQIQQLASVSYQILELCLERLVGAGQLELKGNAYQLAGQSVSLSGPVAAIWKKVEPVLGQDPCRPPVLHDLAKGVGLPPAAVEKLLNQAVAAGLLVRPVPNRYFLPAGIEQLRQAMLATAQAAGPDGFDVKQYRDHCGLGRNLCIEMLEYFDRKGLTMRVGDKRKLRAAPGNP